MGTAVRNFRYAVRMLVKSPTFTLTAVLCLGLAIGASTTLFGIFNTLLWKPMPAAEPGRLVRLFSQAPGQGRLYRNFSYPEYQDYLRETGVLAGLVGTSGVEVGFRGPGAEAARAFGEAVTDGYFQVLGVRAQLGRVLARPEGGAGNTTAEVVLGHRFWRRRLHSDPAIVGKTVWLTGVPFVVAGVAARGFNGTYPSPIFAPEFWVPIGALPQLGDPGRTVLADRSSRSLGLLGRLHPGVDVERARAALATVASRLERSYPDTNKGVKVFVFKELDTHPEVYSSRAMNLVAVLFLGLAAMVLVVACANLANLMLARAAYRRKEIAVRLALGAGRRHLVQQLVTEAVVLALLAGGVGLLAGYAASRAISSVRLPMDVPIAFDVAIDLRVLCFTLAVSLAAGLAFGLLPAIGASRPELVPALKGESAARRRRRFGLTNLLVVAQVAVSLVLIVTAGLFWRSISGASTIDPGMELSGRSLVSFNPSLLRYDAGRRQDFYQALLDRVRRAPEVDGAALVGWVPLGFQFDEENFVVEGAAPRPGEEATRALANVVTPGFFDTAGVVVRKGRPFTERDTADSLPVAIVNETFAAREWPGREAVGQRLRADGADPAWLTVVGVVADGKYRTLTEAPQPYLLRPLSQRPTTSLTLIVRSGRGHAAALAAVRREVREIDPAMPLLDAKTMEQQMAKVRFLPQAMAALAGPAAVLALLIASIGLYGVIAYSVGRRTREFGIKLALGARAGDVVRQVMSHGMWLVASGLAIGAAAALAAARLMRGLLVGVQAGDPVIFVGTLGLLAAVATLAIYLPARRASRVDPLVALRQE